MIMRPKQEGNVVIFELEGHLDFESTAVFEQTIEKLIGTNDDQRVIINLEKLRFVGSTGINQFIKVIKNYSAKPNRPKLCKVSSEFTKLFKAYQTSRHPFEFFENEAQAILAFDMDPQQQATEAIKRKRSH